MAPAVQELADGVLRPADQRPARAYLASLSEGSRRTQADALGYMADRFSGGRCDLDTLPWERLRPQHTGAMRAHLKDRFAPATATRYLSALRKTLRHAWRLGYMTADDYQRTIDLDPVGGSRISPGRGLSGAEIGRLFTACAAARHPAMAARDAALVAILYALGPRRTEAVRLPVEAYDRTTGLVKILGKGNKERTGYAVNATAEAVNAWLEFRGDAPGPLLCPVGKGGRIDIRPMTAQAIYARAKHLARKAGIPKFSPHDMRRSFVSDLLDEGVDLATAQQLAGHASPATTAKYDRRGERAKKRAVERLKVPYFAPGAEA